MNNDYPVIDGIAPSWADVSVKATPDGAPLIDMKDIKSINLGRSADIGEQRAGGRVKKRTWGSGKQDASWTLYKEGAENLRRGIIASPKCLKRGNVYLLRSVHFEVHVMYTPPGTDQIFEKIARGCFYTGDADNGSEGSDPNVEDITLNPLEIVNIIDGKEVAIL
jgi:hypothetical protein